MTVLFLIFAGLTEEEGRGLLARYGQRGQLAAFVPAGSVAKLGIAGAGTCQYALYQEGESAQDALRVALRRRGVTVTEASLPEGKKLRAAGSGETSQQPSSSSATPLADAYEGFKDAVRGFFGASDGNDDGPPDIIDIFFGRKPK